MLYWAAGEYADGAIAGTLIAAFVLVVFPVADAFLPVSEAVEKIPQYRNSLERLSGVVGEEQNIVSEQAFVVDVLPQAIKSAHIKLENVGYRYGSEDNWSVRDLSLDIPQGKKLPSSAVAGQGNRRC